MHTLERISAEFTKKPESGAQAAVTARELEILAQRSDVLVPALHSATLDAGSQVRSILDHVFVLVVLLVLVILLAALAYRAITARLGPLI